MAGDITLDGYRQVFKQNGLWTAYGNTLFYTTVGTVFNLAATTIAAYPLSRNRFFARRFFNFFIAFTMYFSGGMIPTYLLITKLGFYNSRWVMIIPSLLSTYNVMVCRSAFSAIPDEVIESAEIDGSNEWQTFGHIAVRLITPTLAVLTLYYAVGHWNNFFTALLYLSKEELMPMQVLLRRVLIQETQANSWTTAPRPRHGGRIHTGAICYHSCGHAADTCDLSASSKILRQRRNAGRSQRLSARAGKERTYAL